MPPPRMRGVCPDTLDAVSGALKHAVSAPCLIALALVLGSGLGAAPSPSVSGTRLAGVRLGPHAVGFAVRSTVDPTRHVNAVDAGVRINLATWYPATRYASMAPAMTALAYHLLPLGTADDADRRRYEEDEITALCSWRHVGIVELTREQASQSLHTAGIARRDAPAHEGTWPVVLLMGGPFYLASTAEMLASHGFVVIAPFRTDDQQNDVSAQAFPWYLENAVRDAEWAVHVVLSSRRIAPPRLFAMGHGGGGMQALLFTMRNRNVSALVDIDAANFSSRSRARDLAFYSPRLLRVPYLHILREETRRDQDQYDDFTAMAFSRRVEVVLQDEAVRHHDLSDIGRAVAQPMRIRGDAQSSVEREYADVQDTIVRFLQAPADAAGQTAAETWLTSHDGASRHAVEGVRRNRARARCSAGDCHAGRIHARPAPRRARPRSERRGVRRHQPCQDHRARDGRARAANGHRDRGREPRDPSRRSRVPGAEERSVPGCRRSCGGAVSCSRVRRDAGRRRLARQGDGDQVSRRGEAPGQGLAARVGRL